MDQAFVSFLSGVVVALIVAISANVVTYIVAKKTMESNLAGINKTVETSLKTTEKTIAGNLESTRQTIDGNLKGIEKTIAGNLESTKLTIEQEKLKMSEEERQKRTDKKHQVYSQLRGLIKIEDQLTTTLGVGIMYIGYYTTKYKLSNDKKDIEKAEKWREDVNKYQLDLAKCNQTLWEILGLAELLFPEIEKKIASSKETLYNAESNLDPIFQSKKKEALASNIISEEQLEAIKEKAGKEIQSKIIENIVKPLNEILNQMQKAIGGS